MGVISRYIKQIIINIKISVYSVIWYSRLTDSIFFYLEVFTQKDQDICFIIIWQYQFQ